MGFHDMSMLLFGYLGLKVSCFFFFFKETGPPRIHPFSPPHPSPDQEDLKKKKNKNNGIRTTNKSPKKRFPQPARRRPHNRLFHKTARNAVKALRAPTEKSAAEALLPKVTAMLDKLAKHNIVHKNKAGNLKSAMQLHVNAL